jgi:hypothetical protein
MANNNMTENVDTKTYINVYDPKQFKSIKYLLVDELQLKQNIHDNMEFLTRPPIDIKYTFAPVIFHEGRPYISVGYYVRLLNRFDMLTSVAPIIPNNNIPTTNTNTTIITKNTKNKTDRVYKTKLIPYEKLCEWYDLSGQHSDYTTILRDKISNTIVYSNGKLKNSNSSTHTVKGQQLTVCAVIYAMTHKVDYQMINAKHLDINGKMPDKKNFLPSQIVCWSAGIPWKDIPRESQSVKKSIVSQLNDVTPSNITNVVDADADSLEKTRLECLNLALRLSNLLQTANVDKTIKEVCSMILSK